MKLYLSAGSPFARIVRITALRAGHQHLELQLLNPWDNPAALEAVNPFSQVPTLITDNGVVLTHSLSICGYLDDSIFRGAKNAQIAGIGFTLLEQFSKFFGLQYRIGNAHLIQPHPHVARAKAALIRGLPHIPLLNVEKPQWGDYLLAVALEFIARDADIFSHISTENKTRLAQFAQLPLMQQTAASAYKK